MEITLLLKIAGIGLIVAVLQQVLSKSGRDEYAMLTVLSGVLLIIFMLLPQLETLLFAVENFFDI